MSRLGQSALLSKSLIAGPKGVLGNTCCQASVLLLPSPPPPPNTAPPFLPSLLPLPLLQLPARFLLLPLLLPGPPHNHASAQPPPPTPTLLCCHQHPPALRCVGPSVPSFKQQVRCAGAMKAAAGASSQRPCSMSELYQPALLSNSLTAAPKVVLRNTCCQASVVLLQLLCWSVPPPCRAVISTACSCPAASARAPQSVNSECAVML